MTLVHANNLTPSGSFQFMIAPNVIRMVVSIQNMSQPPSVPLQDLLDREEHGGVDHGRLSRFDVDQKMNVIVTQHRERKDFHKDHRIS